MRIEELWGDGHGDWEVGTKLIVGPFVVGAGTVDIFVDSAAVDEGCVYTVLRVFGWV